ncbi:MULTISPECIES: hypothetical protein [Methylorubrum]|uniref:hypothetical protein n=1 Tax=Methylorubrum TaxID=2282523 RepID=UPI0020A02C05|nr:MULTISPECIES: hypothetical protein [Methylorubrum]MCP1550643.1 hypothetical protein [Methylorubrum zatmanii]MCP1552744.1 hypothetical protein [Methylorubrum extorquens]MCP1580946.1 hypothetical protein [Methylorubrum extorquens]
MRSTIALFIVTWGLIELGRLISEGFSWGFAAGCAYASLIAFVSVRRLALANSTEGRTDRG